METLSTIRKQKGPTVDHMAVGFPVGSQAGRAIPDPEAMSQADIDELVAATRALVDEQLDPLSQEIEETDSVPESAVRQLAQLGYFGLTIPQEYGGLGLSALAFVSVIVEIGRTHRAYYGLIENNNGMPGDLIARYGSNEQKQRWLPAMAAGETVTGFCLTEPGAGSDAESIRTTARRTEGGFVLDGLKHFVSNAQRSTHFVVMTKLDNEGIGVFMVDRDTPGLTVGRRQAMMGLRGASQNEVILQNCRVTADALIGDPAAGFRSVTGALRLARLARGAIAIGTGKRALELATEYARDRRQFGQPIGTFQGIQWLLADSATELFAAESMLLRVAAAVDAGTAKRREPSMVKLFASEVTARVVDRALQVLGGSGYTKDLPYERFYRDVRADRLVEGTSEIQRMIIAKSLLRDVGLR
jgi:acyl-CoA dehydrogenase